MEKLNCAIIGAGWWATYAHVPALQTHPHANLLAIQKRSIEGARKVAEDFAIPHAFSSVDELLDLPGLQAVVVSSTPNMHHAQAKAALEKGLHVLVEKPMTLTLDEAVELHEIAEARSVQLLISCPWHYTRHGIEARRRIMNGSLGKVRMISVLMTNPVAHLLRGESTKVTHDSSETYMEPQKGSYSDAAVAGGGQIMCQVSHVASYLTYLTGQMPGEVFARFDNAGSANDIYDTLNIRMRDGTLVSLASTGATMPGDRNYEVRIYGDVGMILMELWKGTMIFHAADGASEEIQPLEAHEIYPDQAPARNLVDSAFGIAGNQSPGNLGVAAMSLIDAAFRSVASGKNEICSL